MFRLNALNTTLLFTLDIGERTQHNIKVPEAQGLFNINQNTTESRDDSVIPLFLFPAQHHPSLPSYVPAMTAADGNYMENVRKINRSEEGEDGQEE